MTGPFQVMPPLSDDEYADLRRDIARNGITVPVVYDQRGRLIDGHHRLQIAAELGIENVPQVVREVVNAQHARSIAYALNLHRRHLSREAKRELLATSIKSDPELSNREHARRVGTSDHTAAVVRDDLEATAQVAQLAERTGADGKARPAKVTTTTRTSEATKVERHVDTDTGEIIEPGDAAYRAGQDAADATPLPTPLPSPVRDHEHDRLVQQNTALARAVNRLDGMADPVARARYVREWDPALCAENPAAMTPPMLRAIAHGLIAFAHELETNRGLRIV